MRSVLLVEDSAEDAELIAEALSSFPGEYFLHRVDTLRDFNTQLEGQPDLILADFNLPGFNAIDVLDELRSRQIDIPVIIVTGSLTDEVAHTCLGFGAVDYILKDMLGRLGSAIKRALAEQDLRNARAAAETALRESEQRFRQIAETVGEAVWLTDAKTGRVIYVSPAYEKIWHRPCETLYGNPDAWMDAVHPEDRGELHADGRHLLEVEYRIVHPDGAFRWINDRSFVVKDAEGRIERIVRVAQDVTRRHQLEDQLRHAQKIDAVGQFAGSVAHDFRNVLTIITGHGQLALGRLGPDDPLHQHLVQITSAASRASALTEQLLAFSRKQMLRPSRIDINAIVANVERMIKGLVGTDVQLTVSLDPALDTVQADPSQMEQVVLNLVNNSRDAIPESGTIRIETRNAVVDAEQCLIRPDLSPGRYVKLIVSDTGVGMDQATQAHIFEPFFTTKPVGKGTGLGLAAVYGIVKQSGGFIFVDSAPQKGTNVTIYLPAIQKSGQ
jgi:two-component system cell cycle sensor histidine kinase/response regulator CckA